MDMLAIKPGTHNPFNRVDVRDRRDPKPVAPPPEVNDVSLSKPITTYIPTPPKPPTPIDVQESNDQLAGISDKDDDGVVDAAVPGTKTYTRDEILPLMDSLLNNGYAIESFKIGNIPVTIRTRFTWEDAAIYAYLEKLQAKSPVSYQHEFSRALIAASLVQFRDNIFDIFNAGDKAKLDKSLNDRIEFVKSLNSVFNDIISNKLAAFDDKQRYIINNFEELLKDF